MSLYNKIIDLQKLQKSWKQVYKNKPGEGIDGVSCEEFEDEKNIFLKELWTELSEHTYECHPVRLVPIYKGEKVRYISMYTMRDKVVQNSLAKELSLIYENDLRKCCYAYRSGKSAMHAAQEIQKRILEMRTGAVLKADIHAFFDCISHKKLEYKLKERIREADVLELLFKIITTPSIGKDGKAIEKKLGIYQGATVAPILSNIYMMEIDEKIEDETDFYIRYSDDILLLFGDINTAKNYKKKLEMYIESLGLELNQEKTKIVTFEEGFEFLGYAFDNHGMSIPEKAEVQLEEKLEALWLNKDVSSFEERLKKGIEIIGGWEQYFRSERKIHSILEYTIWIYQMEKKPNFNIDEALNNREGLKNCYKDVMLFLASIWEKYGQDGEVLKEYEQFYDLDELDSRRNFEKNESELKQLMELYKKFVISESDDVKMELIQVYTDLKMYQKAERIMNLFATKIHRKKREKYIQYSEEAEIVLSETEIGKYMELFVGREDLYAVDGFNNNHRRHMEEVLSPLLSDIVKKHIGGRETIGTYIQRSNGTVKYMVIDLDVSKGILLQGVSTECMHEYLKECGEIAAEILKELDHMGLTGYLEQSGYRGYHIWIFFSEWIPVRYANFLSDVIEKRKSQLWRGGKIQVEYFPNKTRIRNDKKGQVIKLPWGIHPKTGQRSFFLDYDFQKISPQVALLEDVARYSLNTIKKVVAANHNAENFDNEKKYTEVDKNLEEFEIVSDAVLAVMNSCNLIRFLCQKARRIHYLNHCERLSVLYVFGHMGDDGKEFIHKIMSFTLNYSYQITQKFILRCPEKPVSCLKLREQYKQISAEVGCSCGFRRTKNCYPSPVLHALKNSEDNNQITMPVSKTIPTDKQKVIKNEINAVSRAQELAEKMMEIRKQKRNLDKIIEKYERELSEIFDDCQTDSMEIKMGLLVRNKKEDKTEWVIQI